MRGVFYALVLAATVAGQGQLDQARKLSAEGRPELALALYEEALEKTPNSYDANLGAGRLLDLIGQYGKARKYLNKAIAVAPEQSKPQALTAMATSYAFSGDCKNASKFERENFDLRISAANWIDAAEVANEAGRICLEAGALIEAENWYQTGHETALKNPNLSAEDKELWTLRWESAQARLAARRGQGAVAEQHAQVKAILDEGTNPAQALFYPYLAGYLAFYAGNCKTSTSELEKADQNDPFVLSLLAQSWEKCGKKDKALAVFRTILAINEHNIAVAFALPLARKKVGRKV